MFDLTDFKILEMILPQQKVVLYDIQTILRITQSGPQESQIEVSVIRDLQAFLL